MKGKKSEMKPKIYIFAALALLLILAGGALTAAQSDDPAKKIPRTAPGDATGNLITWYPAEKEPDSYRLSWTISKRWRSIRSPTARSPAT